MRRRRLRGLRTALTGALFTAVALTSWDAGASGHADGSAGTALRPPRVQACYRLGLDQATRPTSDASPVPCTKRHTAQTYVVWVLDTVVDGHLLAVDSDVAERQVARTCPSKLDDYVGGSEETRALSRLRAVWFSRRGPANKRLTCAVLLRLGVAHRRAVARGAAFSGAGRLTEAPQHVGG